MYVIIVGAGRVGLNLAQSLIREGLNVTIIENDSTISEEVAEQINAMVIHGDATSVQVLEDADITDADVLVAATGHDTVNLLTSVLSQNYDNIKKIIARVNDLDHVNAFKRVGIDRDNVYMIGLNCGGTVRPAVAEEMIRLFYELDPEDIVSEEINKGKFIVELKDGSEKSIKMDDLEDEGYGRRENCQRCELKIPRKADIACGNWGSSKGYTFVEINTPRGEELVQYAIDNEYIEVKKPSEKQLVIRSKIEQVMKKMAKRTQKKYLETEFTKEEKEDILNRCIKCFRCRDVCPVCNCVTCSMEKEEFKEHPSQKPDPLLMHGIRLGHMAFSCINCGQCDDACPMEIPVSRLFQNVQLKYTKDTGYVSGVSENKPPMYSGEKEKIIEGE